MVRLWLRLFAPAQTGPHGYNARSTAEEDFHIHVARAINSPPEGEKGEGREWGALPNSYAGVFRGVCLVMTTEVWRGNPPRRSGRYGTLRCDATFPGFVLR